jgi:ABC-2 type transport system permease protein
MSEPSHLPSERDTSFRSGILSVAQREFRAYFDSPIAYITASAFLVLSGGMFMNTFFLNGIVDMGAFFRTLPILIALFIPAITMRTWSEEYARGTFEILMALPLKPYTIVLGKYLAALAFYSVILAGSFPIVVMLYTLGTPNLGILIASYMGSVLLGGFFLSLGCFLSGLSREQIVSYVLTTFVGSLFVVTGIPQVVEVVDGLLPSLQIGTWLYESISVLPHYESFCRGIIGVGDLLYFGLMVGFFLAMNEMTLKLSRY